MKKILSKTFKPIDKEEQDLINAEIKNELLPVSSEEFVKLKKQLEIAAKNSNEARKMVSIKIRESDLDMLKKECYMSKGRPADITWISAYLTVRHVDVAANFYQKAFKFEIKELVPGEDGSNCYGELRYNGELIMLGKEGAWGKTAKSPASSGIECPMGLYIYCENVDLFYQHAVDNGAVSVDAPADMFWGDRMCRLKDPDHYIWSFATFSGERK